MPVRQRQKIQALLLGFKAGSVTKRYFGTRGFCLANLERRLARQLAAYLPGRTVSSAAETCAVGDSPRPRSLPTPIP